MYEIIMNILWKIFHEIGFPDLACFDGDLTKFDRL